MPNIKAAVKWVRQSESRSQRNLESKTRLKTLYKKAAASSDLDLACEVEGAFDKAASKGIIHPNKAARKKSRLAKALRAAATQPAATSAAKAPSARKPASKRKTSR